MIFTEKAYKAPYPQGGSEISGNFEINNGKHACFTLEYSICKIFITINSTTKKDLWLFHSLFLSSLIFSSISSVKGFFDGGGISLKPYLNSTPW